MNLVERAKWIVDSGIEVHFARVKKSPTDTALSDVPTIKSWHITQNKRYVPITSALRVARYCKSADIDILLITDARDLSLAAWVKRFNKKVSTIYMQGMKLGMPKKGVFHTWRFNELNAWVSPLPYLQDQVKSWTRLKDSKSFCIPLGVDKNRVIATRSKEEMREDWMLNAEYVFGVLGRFDSQKGQKQVVQAFISAFEASDPVALILKGDPTIGEGEVYLHEVQEMISGYNRSHQIKVMPFDPHVSNFFAGIDTLVMASKSETYGMVTVEALHAGRFVIGTNSGGTPDILKSENVGELYEFGDIDGLATVMKSARLKIPDSVVIKDYANSRFSKEKEVISLLELFKNLTSRR